MKKKFIHRTAINYKSKETVIGKCEIYFSLIYKIQNTVFLTEFHLNELNGHK